MFLLDVLSPDPAFRQVFREQGAAGTWGDEGNLSVFADAAVALEIWQKRLPGLMIIDAATDVPGHAVRDRMEACGQTDMPAVLFLVGETKSSLEALPVTEVFSKPVRLGALIARWQFYRHLGSQQAQGNMVLGSWRIDSSSREAQDMNTQEKTRLTEKENRLLAYFYQATEPLSRESLLGAVWGYDGAMDTHTLETHLTSLRRKLERACNQTRGSLFLVERGRYRLNPLWLTS